MPGDPPATTDRPGLILQHAPTGPAGRLGAWADERGLPYRVHRSWEQSPDLDPTDYGRIASLGSALSANQVQPGWIPAEIALLRGAVDSGVPVLGLCWGAQALARALGGEVGRGPVSEKGWLTIQSTDPEVPPGPWLFYHDEIFTVPGGATTIGTSPAGPAGFRIGPHLALQFHPEADATIAGGWAGHDDAQDEASRAAFRAEGERCDGEAGALAPVLFDAWWAGVSAPAAK
jgi:GMP synthase-like glutamine amidotransferase